MNVIFAGDFVQLPPAIGGEASSLYGPCDRMHAASPRSQEMAMGKAIWHQVTMVVILRQNMRQRTQSPEDEKLRTALTNMRYKSVTKSDIAFLNSKVAGKPTAVKITDPAFRNVSIITGLNSSRTTEDDWANRPCGKSARSNVRAITPHLRELLWAVPPSANDKHIPATLSLCKGMPVMIRSNSATELCITKGQEGSVYSWTGRVLEVLFVSLIDPPTDIRIPGLPLNVIPIVCTSNTIVCSLPDDNTIKLSRTQVEVITNFSMTDFASQGKTRPFNPCRP
ncbi:uncharacterized protein EV420DRAFT_1622065 [Desarmillaria tabescens]|uniref:DNA helicase n=1 Tax=Armillaria tabescens TaxID=1929756 RepID=A0AA39MXL2_ARMTA|nr:uncharacterized protein EV420DRAFT_1622065 [Desarmillaria tabescens]KAK0449809.1 hypothetical protein EV420DRAFT_1622065 [Desarmillaria tabescens]